MILLSGGGGKLGREILSSLNHKGVIAPRREDLNLSNQEELHSFCVQNLIQTVIHAAAWTDVEGCECDEKRCLEDNFYPSISLATVAAKIDLRVIFISSTGIYGAGKQDKAFTETDTPQPSSVHHKAKYAAEKALLSKNDNTLVLRTGWLFGGADISDDFVVNRLKEAKGGDRLISSFEQTGNPTYVPDLAKQIKAVINTDLCGVANAVNSPSCSRFSFTKKILDFAGLRNEVSPVLDSFFKRKAPVSLNESAINETLDHNKLSVMGSWEPGLAEFIARIRSEEENYS